MACERKGLRPWGFKGLRALGLEVLSYESIPEILVLRLPAPLTHSLRTNAVLLLLQCCTRMRTTVSR